MTMHSELPVAEHLHPRPCVVFHKDTAVTASLIPVTGQPIAIGERCIDVIAVVHHQAVTGAMKAIEQTELFFRPAQAVARRNENALRDGHSHPGVEVALQDSMV